MDTTKLSRRELLATASSALVIPALSPSSEADAPEEAASPLKIMLNKEQTGREFEGLGAVSGGGNTSRLLPDYPEPQRSEILDYLFRPGFAASLSALKVEVGGDINSTEGSEPSHMHTSSDENYTRGFEWWLMVEAKKRNHKIALDCLAWGAPGWIGGGNYWSTDMMEYYIKFILAARRVYGLEITSVGGKNESGYNTEWYINFRKALNTAGLEKVRLVASDDWGPPWLNIAKEAVSNSALAEAIDVFGGHVTWSEKPAVASEAILNLNKPLWDTELHNYYPGFQALIQLVHAFNLNYILTKITKSLTWNLIWSYYTVSSYPDVGMIRAHSPWSGHYELLPVVWGYAHINQFTKPGWVFLEGNANGYLPMGGTYTTLTSPDYKEVTLLVETSEASSQQSVQLLLGAGFSARTLHVWQSTEASQFEKVADIHSESGVFTIQLAPQTVYSISTTTGQRKGSHPKPPAEHPLSLPYTDDYQSYLVSRQARYHFDYEGAFEIAWKTVGEGKCLRQAAIKSSLGWGGAYMPLTFLGSTEWKDYSISVEAYIEGEGAVSLHGRIGTIPGGNDTDPPGYTFRIHSTGDWELVCFKTKIASGHASFAADVWHTLELSFSGTTINVFADGLKITSMTNEEYSAGLAGMGTGWNFAQFSNLKIVPLELNTT